MHGLQSQKFQFQRMISAVKQSKLLRGSQSKDLNIFEFSSVQSRIQSPQALWPAVGHQENLWGTGILLPQDSCGKTLLVLKFEMQQVPLPFVVS